MSLCLLVIFKELSLSYSFSDEAFAAKNMPDLGHEIKDFKVYSWRLTHWRKLEKKITSPEFECGGHKWYAAHPFLQSCTLQAV